MDVDAIDYKPETDLKELFSVIPKMRRPRLLRTSVRSLLLSDPLEETATGIGESGSAR